MHAPKLGDVLASIARVLTNSNKHPDTLKRLLPDPSLAPILRTAACLCLEASTTSITSSAGTNLNVAMGDARTVEICGVAEKPGMLVLDANDINLTFKRCLSEPVRLTLESDYVSTGADAELMRRHLMSFAEKDAYTVTHIDFGLNMSAHHEALAFLISSKPTALSFAPLTANF